MDGTMHFIHMAGFGVLILMMFLWTLEICWHGKIQSYLSL